MRGKWLVAGGWWLVGQRRLLPVFVLLFSIFVFSPAAHAAGCSSTSLGNNWTCVAGNHAYAIDFSSSAITLTLPGAVSAGDLLVYCYNWGLTGSVSDNLTLSDNAGTGNTWTQYPPGPQLQSLDVTNGSWSCWYVLNSQAKASGYTLSITGTSTNHVGDHGIAQFRNSGGASAGIDATNGSGTSGTVSVRYTSNATSASTNCTTAGNCPSGFNGSSFLAFDGPITTGFNGELLLAGLNMKQSPLNISSGWTAVDSDASECPVSGSLPVCIFAANSQATAGSVTFAWSDNTASDPYWTALMAFRPPAGAASCKPTLLLMGEGRCGYLIPLIRPVWLRRRRSGAPGEPAAAGVPV
jgi:hypothetical protein